MLEVNTRSNGGLIMLICYFMGRFDTSGPSLLVALCARQPRTQLAKPNSREQFCSAECRQQTAVRRGQSVGQLRHHEGEEDLEKDLKKIPIVITRSGLGNSRHRAKELD